QLHTSGTKGLRHFSKNENICRREIQVSCSVFQRIPNIASRFTIQDRYVRFICTKYFEKHGRNIYKCSEPEKFQTCIDNKLHIEDKNHILRVFYLETPESFSSSLMNIESCLPSPLLVEIAIKINKFNNFSSANKHFVKVKECCQFRKL
ncbi:12050_t:CDS:2, partial [Gigaspora rosea]